ncbi:MAG: SUMF1/EgtB/PvdO family nonheme iron enzyme [Anaerolineae bacterium]|nr:SUMF1/EgtB/PvdO family nonheme iron enzyme [Anaerolineae bacterium]
MADEQLIQQLQQALSGLQASDADAIPRLTQTLESIGVGNGKKTTGETRETDRAAIGDSIQTIIRQGSLPEQVISTLTDIHHTLRMFDKQALRNYDGPRRRIRVFIASPSDVAEERGIAMTVIERLNTNPLFNEKLEIEVFVWDRPGAYLSIADRPMPQENINRSVLPSGCDLVVAIFWTQMGSPLDTEYLKPETFRYLHETEWETRHLSDIEYQWVDATQAAIEAGKPAVLTYRRTEKVLLDPDEPGFAANAEQRRRVNAFFDHLNEIDLPTGEHYHPYEKPADFEYLFEAHLLHQIKILLDAPEQLDLATEHIRHAWPADRPPFPGMRPFDPQDMLTFFGRGAEIDALVRRLTRDRFVAVVAPPGAGKSSLLQAGLLPRLESGVVPGVAGWYVIMFTPGETEGGNPFYALAARLQPDSDSETLMGYLQGDPAAAMIGLCQDSLKREPEGTEILLLVDQFEDLFTTVDESYREPFARALAAMAEYGRARVVIALSTGTYDCCMKLSPLKPLLETGTYPLYPPERSRLYEMLAGPAGVAGLSYEDGLAQRILKDTSRDPDDLLSMAYALELLWRSRNETSLPSEGRNTVILTHSTYDMFGGVQGAIGSQAHGAYLALPFDEATRKAASKHVFARLISVCRLGDGSGYAATCRHAPLETVRGDDGSPEAWLVDALIDARLLVTHYDPNTAQPLLAIAHEALFWKWDLLRTWIDKVSDALRLIDAAGHARREWEANAHQPDFLWPPGQIRQLWNALDSHPELAQYLTPADWNFLMPEQERLEEELLTDIDHGRRAEIGLRLHIIGDTRPGVGLVRPQTIQNDTTSRILRLWGDGPEHEGLPDIVWLPVKGTENYRLETNEGERGSYTIQDFYIAKYPITYQQYRVFLDANDGFQDPRWWEGLAANEDNKSRPGEQRFKYNNYPAENVSWYDAIAFCRWLNARLGLPDIPIDLQIGPARSGWLNLGAIATSLQDYPAIRLPTEWEWQWAATGGTPGYAYPWGPEWDDTLTNTSESGLNRTTAVGIHPANAAICGALDMSGNVWEWCLNEYDNPQNIGLGGGDGRVVRGGSWGSYQDQARTTCRLRLGPLDRSNSDGGFRICMGCLTARSRNGD